MRYSAEQPSRHEVTRPADSSEHNLNRPSEALPDDTHPYEVRPVNTRTIEARPVETQVESPGLDEISHDLELVDLALEALDDNRLDDAEARVAELVASSPMAPESDDGSGP